MELHGWRESTLTKRWSQDNVVFHVVDRRSIKTYVSTSVVCRHHGVFFAHTSVVSGYWVVNEGSITGYVDLPWTRQMEEYRRGVD